MRTIGAPASTWTFAAVSTDATVPANGAVMVFSIFMLSTTAMRVTLGHPVAGLDEHRQHESRSAATHDAAVVAEHGVRGAVDVDTDRGSLHDRDHAVHPAADDHPALEPSR